ncbi:hypothetical protein [Zavarzinia sp.]|uniref:hypothetical protein n=1 Tax=Zavarzinia sp. TaxID=2027920 RepID=UPI003565A524
MLIKNWIDGVTRLYAAEADAMAKLLNVTLMPCLGGAMATATAAAPSINGTRVEFAALGAEDGIVTGNALATAYYRDYVDFATGSEIGGPLAAGAYTLYFDIQESAGPVKTYLIKAAAVLTSEGVDDALYLVVATVAWNGTDTLSSLVDLRAGQWGALDLTGMGRGDRTEVIIGDGRDWRFEGDVQVDGRLTAKAFLDVGVVGVGGGTVNLYGLTGDHSAIISGFVDWAVEGPLVFTPGVAGKIDLNLGTNGVITVPSSADINVAGVAQIQVGGLLDVLGTTAFGDNSLSQINTAADFHFESGSFTGTPTRNQFTGASILKAWARVQANGTITSNYNVASVTASGSGVYAVTFKRAMLSAALGAPMIIPYGNSSDWHLSAMTIDVDHVDFTLNIGGLGANSDFIFILAGGNQAADA